jgi:Leucine-rich repeat (LRR) protein
VPLAIHFWLTAVSSLNTIFACNSEIALIQSLEKLFLGVNNITSIPTEIGLLSESLRVLNMMHCTIESELPSELGMLKSLQKLDLVSWYWSEVY